MTQMRTITQGTCDAIDQYLSILLLVDLFTKTLVNKPMVSFDISSTLSTKFGICKGTTANLKWHKPEEFAQLSSETKNELEAR